MLYTFVALTGFKTNNNNNNTQFQTFQTITLTPNIIGNKTSAGGDKLLLSIIVHELPVEVGKELNLKKLHRIIARKLLLLHYHFFQEKHIFWLS